jgi:hypothetical protein
MDLSLFIETEISKLRSSKNLSEEDVDRLLIELQTYVGEGIFMTMSVDDQMKFSQMESDEEAASFIMEYLNEGKLPTEKMEQLVKDFFEKKGNPVQ